MSSRTLRQIPREGINLDNQLRFYKDLFKKDLDNKEVNGVEDFFINDKTSEEYIDGEIKVLSFAIGGSNIEVKGPEIKFYAVDNLFGTNYRFYQVAGTSDIFYEKYYKIFIKLKLKNRDEEKEEKDDEGRRKRKVDDNNTYLVELLDEEIHDLADSSFFDDPEPKVIDITESVSFYDPIEMEVKNTTIQEYIRQDRNNIVIGYDVNNYFLTTRHIINDQQYNSTIYPCQSIDSMANILKGKPLYNLRQIGFIYNYYIDMTALFYNRAAQLFVIVDSDEEYPTFVSHPILYDRVPNYVSGFHCQSGLGSKISYIEVAVPAGAAAGTVTGGISVKRKHVRIRKNRTRKTSKTRKTRRLYKGKTHKRTAFRNKKYRK